MIVAIVCAVAVLGILGLIFGVVLAIAATISIGAYLILKKKDML